MKVDSLSELKKVIQLCRKSGVTSIEIDGIKMNISLLAPRHKKIDAFPDLELPPEANLSIPQYKPTVQEVAEKIATDELSEEQLMFYSARAEAPEFKEQ